MVELGQHAARSLRCLPCAIAVGRLTVWCVVRVALATYVAVATHLTTRAHSSVWGGAVHYGGEFLEGAGKPPSADFNQKKSADEPLRKRRGSGTLARGMTCM